MKVKEAKEYGRKAFNLGINAPILDKEFHANMSRLNATNELLAWHEGWTEANLAAPVKSV